MCGRYSLTTRGGTIAEAFELAEGPELEPRFNIGPGQPVPIVRAAEESRRLAVLQWGFHRGAPAGGMLINARSETAGERPAFRDAVQQRRCLVPASGFYEWRHQGVARAPYHFSVVGAEVFALAGIWSWWPGPAGWDVESMVILTTRPNALLAPIHDRMPVILTPDSYARWLDPTTLEAEELTALTQPLDADLMHKTPVSTRVNSVANDDPDVLTPTTEPPEQLGLFP